MVKILSEPVFKEIIRKVVREEMQSFGISLKEDILSAVSDVLASFRGDMVALKDEIVGELQTMREENMIASAKVRQINELDDKVEKLEKIHPHNSHQPAAA